MTDPTPDPFDQWLTTGTLRRRTVTLYADQDAADELDTIAEAFKEAQKSAKRRTIDTTSPVAELKERWDAAHARWEASRATFTLTRLEEPIREQLAEEFVEPKPPRSPGPGAIDKHKERYGRDLEAWRGAASQVAVERDRAGLAYAIESVEMAGTTRQRVLNADGRVETPAVTPERLLQIFTSPYGPQWRLVLIEAFNEVSKVRGEPERPFSPEPSGSDPT